VFEDSVRPIDPYFNSPAEAKLKGRTSRLVQWALEEMGKDFRAGRVAFSATLVRADKRWGKEPMWDFTLSTVTVFAIIELREIHRIKDIDTDQLRQRYQSMVS
jgi:hypothetical protein